MAPTAFLRRALLAGAAAGAGLTAYALVEARDYTLRHVTLPLLPEGADPLRVLHFSDLHLVPTQAKKLDFVRALATLDPDLVVDTGDNLAHRDSVPVLLDALGPLLQKPGVFVHGSNDYFDPSLRNPLAYLAKDTGKRHINRPELPWRDLSRGFTEAGWLDLSNAAGSFTVRDLAFAFAGLDDPHLFYDDLDAVPEAPEAADVRLGVVHAPYLRTLDRFAASGYDAIIAGHTHGGQVCLPFVGALTTNCDLDNALAKGLHRHPADSEPGDPGSSWLHVSAGLGTNPYTRIRVACRPEATLLTLISRTP